MASQNALYRALKEVSVVLEYTDPNLRAKVPQNFLWFMENYKDDTYDFKINRNKSLQEQNLSYDTIIILSIILKSSWCDRKTLKKLKKMYKIDKKDFMQDRKNKKIEIDNEIRSLTIPKKETFFSKIVTGIRGFFGRNKNRIYIPDDNF